VLKQVNELGNPSDAYTYINMVRKTPGFDGSIYRNIPWVDYANLSIGFRALQERRMEFVAEGQRMV